ncbi:ComEC/Rec2 family competence protein, partial [Desulfovibrio sp. OttesenSCG-928-A18]|nr:ComEC/Rec2 family competence protein [Desulfovibrio sp. OttesenSCG-928-A18]
MMTPDNSPSPRNFSTLLLFSECCVLAAVAGILCTRHWGPGLLLLFFLLLGNLPRGKSARQRLGHCVLLALFFFCGFGYAQLRAFDQAPVPDWLRQASQLAPDAKGELRPQGPIDIVARVESAAALAGGRTRLVLRHARPAAPEAAGPAYQGGIVWTLRRHENAPLPGRSVRLSLRLSPVRGLLNPETWDIERHWHGQKVWFRGSSPGQTGSAPRLPGGTASDPASIAAAGSKAGSGASPAAEPLSGATEPGTTPPWTYVDETPAPGALIRARAALAEARHSLAVGFMHNLGYAPASGNGPDAISARDPGPGPGSAPDPGLTGGGLILPALVFGDRSLLDPEQMALFADATLAHSLALSGMHMGFVLLLAWALAGITGWCLPRLWEKTTRLHLSMLIALPLCLAYLWLGQAPPSLQRAACMIFFWALLVFLRRSKVVLSGLCAAVAFLLLLRPQHLFELGFQLSVLSVAVIGLCLPSIQAWVYRLLPEKGPRYVLPAGADPSLVMPQALPGSRLKRLLRAAISLGLISLCIQIALLPLCVNSFGTAGILFPLNILWLPLLGLLVMPLAFAGLFAGAVGLQLPAQLLLKTAALPCDLLLRLLNTLAERDLLLAPLLPRPHWLSTAGYWLFWLCLPGIVQRLALFLRQRSLRRSGQLLRRGRAAPKLGASAAGTFVSMGKGLGPLFFCACLMMALPPLLIALEQSQSRVSLQLLDVGQGQSLLVSWNSLGPKNDSGRVLIDGGGFGSPFFDPGRSVVAPVLTAQALPRLRAVLNSHPDTDHLEGLVYILEKCAVGAYHGNGDSPPPGLAARLDRALARAGLRETPLRAGDSLGLAPGLRLEVLWPPATEAATGQGKSLRRWPAFTRNSKGTLFAPESRNNRSLVLRLVWQDRSLALVCGDLERAGLRGLLRGTGELGAEVLVLPHHGAASGFFPELYRKVAPGLALASCGYGNRWGFPVRRVREALRELGVPLLSTSTSGQIRVHWTPDGKR